MIDLEKTKLEWSNFFRQDLNRLFVFERYY
jgi:hypothetical protein